MKIVELGIGFLNDVEKMEDFTKVSKEEFLFSYSYLTEDEYDTTKDALVMWSESQDFMGQDGITLINDDVGYRLFGGSAYLVPDELVHADEPFPVDE